MINYYTEYYSIKENCSTEALFDIYGFMITKTCPRDKTHVYYIFEKLEDRYADMLCSLKKEWQTGVPCILYLLQVELKLENNINPKFYEYLQTVSEE
jgi:hypothetical protein